MISDFLWIEKVEENEDEIRLTCELPDIDGDNDEFIYCGTILIKLVNGEQKGSIYLFNNIYRLCEGEVFDKNLFTRDVAFSIKNKYGIDIPMRNYEVL